VQRSSWFKEKQVVLSLCGKRGAFVRELLSWEKKGFQGNATGEGPLKNIGGGLRGWKLASAKVDRRGSSRPIGLGEWEEKEASNPSRKATCGGKVMTRSGNAI